LWGSWELARPEIAEQQVLHTGNAETAAAGAENTKSKGALIIQAEYFSKKNGVSGPPLIINALKFFLR